MQCARMAARCAFVGWCGGLRAGRAEDVRATRAVRGSCAALVHTARRRRAGARWSASARGGAKSAVEGSGSCVEDAKKREMRAARVAGTVLAAGLLLTVPDASALAAASESASSVPAWLPLAMFVAGPVLGLFELLMLVRIPLSWFPATEAKLPWRAIVVATEPLLVATRKVVPPQGGVDVSPVVWFAIISLVRELLVGGQGVLILLQNK